MAEFVDFRLENVVDLSSGIEALDKIALARNGVVARCSGGYTRITEVPPVGDWNFRWIDTKGTGNTGTLVLIPTSPRTRHLAFEGHVAALMTHGFDPETARVIAGTRAPFLRQDAVMDAIAAMVRNWSDCAEIAAREVYTHRAVLTLEVSEEMRAILLGLSARRRVSVKEVARNLVAMR